jgi:hypothetical protein
MLLTSRSRTTFRLLGPKIFSFHSTTTLLIFRRHAISFTYRSKSPAFVTLPCCSGKQAKKVVHTLISEIRERDDEWHGVWVEIEVIRENLALLLNFCPAERGISKVCVQCFMKWPISIIVERCNVSLYGSGGGRFFGIHINSLYYSLYRLAMLAWLLVDRKLYLYGVAVSCIS